MRYRNRRPVTCPEIDEAEWLAAIRDQYGVRLGDGQLYTDTARRVYAGSEYVARLGATTDPVDATDWTPSIAHFPRYIDRLEVAHRETSRGSNEPTQ